MINLGCARIAYCRGDIIKIQIVVDLGVIRRNIERIVSGMACRTMLMAKADAYGHGLERVALATCRSVDSFGVATVEEGEAIRRLGIKNDVLTLICPPREVERAFAAGLIVGVHSFEQILAAKRAVEGGLSKENARVHIKLDTGMHRLGFSASELPYALNMLQDIGASVEGVYSHLRCRDQKQISAFKEGAAAVKARYPHATAHLAASGNLAVKSLQFDGVRIGVAAYRGAMSVYSEVVAARKVSAGEHISYGNFTLDRDANTAIVFGGYGDGVKREYPSSVTIRGKKCAVLGRVCMDMFAVDTGDFLPSAGERVTLLSPDSAFDVARERRTIDYAVYTGWHGRVRRVYVDD